MINEASESFSVQSSKQLEPISETWVALGDKIKVILFHSSKVLKQQCAGKRLTGSQDKGRGGGGEIEGKGGGGDRRRKGDERRGKKGGGGGGDGEKG